MNYDKNLRFRYSQLFIKNIVMQVSIIKGRIQSKNIFFEILDGRVAKLLQYFEYFEGKKPRFENFQTFFPLTLYPSLNKLFYQVIDFFPAKHHQ